jgi:lauroyl/myristoyl acyltransferase
MPDNSTMGISEFLQSPEILTAVPGMQADVLRALILTKACEWFAGHPHDAATLTHNYAAFGLPHDPAFIRDACDQVALHYFEKLLPLCGTPRDYHDFLSRHTDCADAIARLKECADRRQPVLLTGFHFGAVELIVPVLAMHHLPVTPALRFRTVHFSEMAHQRAREMARSGLFGSIGFIEIGKPGTAAALEMSAVLRRCEFLITMVDEKTEYSRKTKLFDREVWGGAGIDRLLEFTPGPVRVFAPAMVRDADRFRLELSEIPADPPDRLIDLVYDRIHQTVRAHPEQWYFLHEEVPFHTAPSVAAMKAGA